MKVRHQERKMRILWDYQRWQIRSKCLVNISILFRNSEGPATQSKNVNFLEFVADYAKNPKSHRNFSYENRRESIYSNSTNLPTNRHPVYGSPQPYNKLKVGNLFDKYVEAKWLSEDKYFLSFDEFK